MVEEGAEGDAVGQHQALVLQQPVCQLVAHLPRPTFEIPTHGKASGRHVCTCHSAALWEEGALCTCLERYLYSSRDSFRAPDDSIHHIESLHMFSSSVPVYLVLPTS